MTLALQNAVLLQRGRSLKLHRQRGDGHAETRPKDADDIRIIVLTLGGVRSHAITRRQRGPAWEQKAAPARNTENSRRASTQHGVQNADRREQQSI